MTKEEFETHLSRACNLFLESVDEANRLLAIYEDVGAEIAPSQLHIDAGVVLLNVVTSLDKGPDSPRAKLNRVRTG